MYENIRDIKRANKALGKTWFGTAEMQIFGTRVSPTVYDGRYFITSDKNFDGTIRQWSIRHADEQGDIATIGEFGGYESHQDAVNGIINLIKITLYVASWEASE